MLIFNNFGGILQELQESDAQFCMDTYTYLEALYLDLQTVRHQLGLVLIKTNLYDVLLYEFPFLTEHGYYNLDRDRQELFICDGDVFNRIKVLFTVETYVASGYPLYYITGLSLYHYRLLTQPIPYFLQNLLFRHVRLINFLEFSQRPPGWR